MTNKDMEDLITIHDAIGDLEKLVHDLAGQDMYMYDDGIMGKLSLINLVLQRNSPLYNDKMDWEDTEYAKIIDDRALSPAERAHFLFDL